MLRSREPLYWGAFTVAMLLGVVIGFFSFWILVVAQVLKFLNEGATAAFDGLFNWKDSVRAWAEGGGRWPGSRI